MIPKITVLVNLSSPSITLCCKWQMYRPHREAPFVNHQAVCKQKQKSAVYPKYIVWKKYPLWIWLVYTVHRILCPTMQSAGTVTTMVISVPVCLCTLCQGIPALFLSLLLAGFVCLYLWLITCIPNFFFLQVKTASFWSSSCLWVVILSHFPCGLFSCNRA